VRVSAGVVTFLFTDIEGSTRRWELCDELGIDLPRRALKPIFCAVNSFEPFGQAVKSFERYASRVAPGAENNPSAGNSSRGKRREKE
jgi:class 3 adenylate cyclase